MLAILRAELYKNARRPAVWICILVLLAVLVGVGYLLVWFVYSHPTPQMLRSLPRGATVASLKTSLYPSNYDRAVPSFSTSIGGAIALVLGVLSVGSEYGWGTVKTLFTQRPGRLTVVAAKLTSLLLTLFLAAALALISAAVTSFVLAGVDAASSPFPAAGDQVRAFLANWLIFDLWGLFGAFLAFAFRQSALAIGLGLVYMLVVEGLLFGTLGSIDAVRTLEKGFPGANATALVQSFGSRGRLEAAGPVTPLVSATQASLVLLAYSAAFCLASGAFVKCRDVT